MAPDRTKTDVRKMKKTASVRPVLKSKDDRTKAQNYMFSELNIISIMFSINQMFIHKKLTKYFETFLSEFILTYLQQCSSNNYTLKCL